MAEPIKFGMLLYIILFCSFYYIYIFFIHVVLKLVMTPRLNRRGL